MNLDSRIRVGATYYDASNQDVFTILGISENEGELVADLSNGQWYAILGEDGLVAKLNEGAVQEVTKDGHN